jgi:peptidoglycan/xylan/chitin deacetylase (PgdA/CDA1 family)
MTATPSQVYLMYHELELPGRPLCQNEPGYVRYIVNAADFRAQMQFLKDSGLGGTNVTAALDNPNRPAVVITFDDGCETDLISAAPILRDFAFNATFYVTVGFLEKRGYLSRAQLRQLSDLGLEIGSHSMTHAYLTDLPQEKVTLEIATSKEELEQIIGRSIQHFSCPGGRWDRRVAETARQCGYRSVTTSRIAANSVHSDPYALGRIAILRGTSFASFQQKTKGHALWKLRFRDSARTAAKHLLGNHVYDFVRAQILRKNQPTSES